MKEVSSSRQEPLSPSPPPHQDKVNANYEHHAADIQHHTHAEVHPIDPKTKVPRSPRPHCQPNTHLPLPQVIQNILLNALGVQSGASPHVRFIIRGFAVRDVDSLEREVPQSVIVFQESKNPPLLPQFHVGARIAGSAYSPGGERLLGVGGVL